MKDDKELLFSFESYQDRETIIKYIDAIKEGFISGEIYLKTGEKELNINTGNLIKLDIKASKNDLALLFTFKDNQVS